MFKSRGRPSGLGFAFADSIDFVEAGAWDKLTKGASLFLSREYLRALESAAPSGLRMRYALLYRGREPVAAAAAQIAQLTAERMVSVAETPIAKLRSKALGKTHVRVLVCGNLLSWGCHGVAFAPGEDPAMLWRGVVEGLYRIHRSERLYGDADLVLIKDTTDATPATDALRTCAFRAIETEPDMVLDIAPSWTRYDDYLGALTSDYRRAARKVAKQMEEAGCRIERLDNLAPHAGRLHELYLQVHNNADVRPITVTPSYFPELATSLGDRFRCVAIRRGGEILGYATLLRDGDTAVFYYLGFDREAARELPIYLRLLHATIEEAIAMRCRRLSMGRTALEPKARLGARPEAMRVWLRHSHPLLNLIVRGLARAVHHQEAPERNPFK